MAPLLTLLLVLFDLLVDLSSDVLLRVLITQVESEHCVPYSFAVSTTFSDTAFWKWTGKAKIANLDMAVFIDEDVGWLDIAVNDVGRVEELHSLQAVVQDHLHMVLVQLWLLFHVKQIFQTGAKMLHNDKNTKFIFVLCWLWDDDVEDVRGAVEVNLSLHVL